jgi:hypothetical protein
MTTFFFNLSLTFKVLCILSSVILPKLVNIPMMNFCRKKHSTNNCRGYEMNTTRKGYISSVFSHERLLSLG